MFGLDQQRIAAVPANTTIHFAPDAFDLTVVRGGQEWHLVSTATEGQHIEVFSPMRNAERPIVAIAVGIVNFWDFAAPLRFGGYRHSFILDSNGIVVAAHGGEIYVEENQPHGAVCCVELAQPV